MNYTIATNLEIGRSNETMYRSTKIVDQGSREISRALVRQRDLDEESESQRRNIIQLSTDIRFFGLRLDIKPRIYYSPFNSFVKVQSRYWSYVYHAPRRTRKKFSGTKRETINPCSSGCRNELFLSSIPSNARKDAISHRLHIDLQTHNGNAHRALQLRYPHNAMRAKSERLRQVDRVFEFREERRKKGAAQGHLLYWPLVPPLISMLSDLVQLISGSVLTLTSVLSSMIDPS